MKKSIIFLIIAVIGATIWNIPDTASLFQGQHTFYNGSAPCTKCHQDIQDILNLPDVPSAHNENIGCRDCHTRDGNSSHAASKIACSQCHPEEIEHANNYKCVICHGSHGSLNPK